MGSNFGRFSPSRLLRGVQEIAGDVHRLAAAAERESQVARDAGRRMAAVEKALVEQRRTMRSMREDLASAAAELRTLRVAATSETMREVVEFCGDHQMSFRETLERLVHDGSSFARFGDGELRMAFDPLYDLGFQVNSHALGEALLETLTSPVQDGLLVGWPRPFRTAHNSAVWTLIWGDVKPLVADRPERFGNSHVSRPSCFHKLGDEAVDLWRQVWSGAHVSIVTGRGSRFDLTPALFDNVRGHEFVYSTPRNAFEDLERLEQEIVSRSRSDLQLIALGPAGTVLAARLAKRGIRAIDVGHISNSYSNVFEGRPHPEKVPPVRASLPAPGL